MMARALITGITGMVGSHLADSPLEKTDWDIHAKRLCPVDADHQIPDTTKIKTTLAGNRKFRSRKLCRIYWIIGEIVFQQVGFL